MLCNKHIVSNKRTKIKLRTCPRSLDYKYFSQLMTLIAMLLIIRSLITTTWRTVNKQDINDNYIVMI
jgi:hypothetical protein